MHLANATNLSDARLRIVDCLGSKHLSEMRDAACVFARGDRRGDTAAKRSDVLGRPDRFLEPKEIVRGKLSRHAASFAERPRAIGVEHECDVGPHCLTCAGDRWYRDLVELDMEIATRHCFGSNPRRDCSIAIAQQARVGAIMAATSAAEKAMEW